MEDKRVIATIQKTEQDADFLSELPYFPSIVSDYDGGMTHAQLANKYDIESTFSLYGTCTNPSEIARGIVGEALRTYHPNQRARKEMSTGRSLDNLIAGEGRLQDLDTDERKAISMAGVLARGRAPLTEEIKKRVIHMSELPEYQTSSMVVDVKKIGAKVGRSRDSVRAIIYRHKKAS